MLVLRTLQCLKQNFECCGSEAICFRSSYGSDSNRVLGSEQDPDPTFKSSQSGSRPDTKYLLFFHTHGIKQFVMA
jgi:hypothetical protein